MPIVYISRGWAAVPSAGRSCHLFVSHTYLYILFIVLVWDYFLLFFYGIVNYILVKEVICKPLYCGPACCDVAIVWVRGAVVLPVS